MSLLGAITLEQHEHALEMARVIGLPLQPIAGRALAPLGADAAKWLNDLWDRVEETLERAVSRGLDAAREGIEGVNKEIDRLFALGKAWVDDVVSVVRARLSEYLRQAMNGALNAVQETIQVNGQELRIEKLDLKYSVKMSASIKGSLLEVCEFVSGGEIELSAHYSFPKSGAD
jgi:hypothetical protein